MEIFLHNLPVQATEKDLHRFLTPHLRTNGILVFHCSRLRKAGCAILTLLNREDGMKVLRLLETELQYQSKTILFKPSHSEPDEWLLKTMQKDLKDQLRSKVKQGSHAPKIMHTEDFAIESLACGLWDYQREELLFISYFEKRVPGTVKFGKHDLEIYLENPPGAVPGPQTRLNIPYFTIQSITTGNKQTPALTISLAEAPRMYAAIDSQGATSASSEIEQILATLGITNKHNTGKWKQKWVRLCHLGGNHEQVVATCLVYRVMLRQIQDLQKVAALEKARGREVPPTVTWPARSSNPAVPFGKEVLNLNQRLASHTSFPFGLNFQLQKLNQNGCLPPSKVQALLPEVQKLVKRSGGDVAAEVIKRLYTQIPFPGPDTPAEDLDHDGLVGLIRELEELAKKTDTASVRQDTHNLCLIYKVIVTPAGVYLYGPDYEVGNRVLRQYSNSASQFLRVSFLDENMEPVRFDADASNDEVFSRFRTKLKDSINLAGRNFKFLGYSHSSLRSQTCWYMAPHVHNGSLLISQILIAKLGDFSAIRCPAKCAARIGQAFSDTTAAVRLSKEMVHLIPDIQRLGRVFSDGVGNLSKGILEMIMAQYPTHHDDVPVAFQIRYAGWCRMCIKVYH